MTDKPPWLREARWAGDGEADGVLYGREELLELARRRVPVVAGGTGQLLLLSGEAGIGKTRLLGAVQDLGRSEGFALWSAGAFPRDVELSAGLLLDLGHTMMRSPRAEVAARGRAMVADVAQVSDDDAADGDAHRRRRLLVLAAAERLASLVEEGPALLALEDLHWCDELSLEVIAHLARRLPSLPLLVVGTLRTDELHDNAPVRSWRSRLLLQRMAEEVRLPRLDAPQTRAMVGALLPGRRVGRRLAELVHERSGGAAPRGGAGPRGGRGHLDADPSYVPESLAEAVLQRFAGPAVRGARRRRRRRRHRPELRPGPPRPGRGSAAAGGGVGPGRADPAAVPPGGGPGLVRLPARTDPGRRRGAGTGRPPPGAARHRRRGGAAPRRAGWGRLPVGTPRSGR